MKNFKIFYSVILIPELPIIKDWDLQFSISYFHADKFWCAYSAQDCSGSRMSSCTTAMLLQHPNTRAQTPDTAAPAASRQPWPSWHACCRLICLLLPQHLLLSRSYPRVLYSSYRMTGDPECCSPHPSLVSLTRQRRSPAFTSVTQTQTHTSHHHRKKQ